MHNPRPRFFPFFYLALCRPKTFFRTYFKEQNVGWPFAKTFLALVILVCSIRFSGYIHWILFRTKTFLDYWDNYWSDEKLLYFIIGILSPAFTLLTSFLYLLIAGAKARNSWAIIMKIVFYSLVVSFAIQNVLHILYGLLLQPYVTQDPGSPLIHFIMPWIIVSVTTVYFVYYQYAGSIVLAKVSPRRVNLTYTVRTILALQGLIKLFFQQIAS